MFSLIRYPEISISVDIPIHHGRVYGTKQPNRRESLSVPGLLESLVDKAVRQLDLLFLSHRCPPRSGVRTFTYDTHSAAV